MTINEFLSRFAKHTKTGGQWLVRCPAHSDDKASLAVREGTEGRIVLHCHAGCSVDAIVATMNLNASDLFADGTSRQQRREVATYDYRDARGSLLYQVVRYEPKDFRQRRPDGAGGWSWKLDGVERVVYRLNELTGKDACVISEGEKDADKLIAIGIPATCNVAGAGKWRSEYAEQLKEAGIKRVVLVPDNDDAGRQHMQKVAQTCLSAGLIVKLVILPDVPPKGDISDYLAKHTKDELLTLLKAAKPYDVLDLYGSTSLPDQIIAPPKLGPVVTCLADVRSERISWLWRRRLAVGKLTLLMGDPGVGKTFITVDATSRLTRGGSWPDGDGVGTPGNVLFLAVEDGLGDTLKPRLERAGADVSRVFVLTTIRDETGERLPNFEQDMAALEQVLVERKPVLVVVDPISSYLGKTDSYKDADVRRVLAPLALLAERHKVAMVALVHMTKGSANGKALYRAMASIAFSALARIHLAAGIDPEQPERCFLMPVKQNICRPAATLAYSLKGDPEDEDGPALLEWEAVPIEGVHADQILGAAMSSSDREEQQDAATFLRELLADGRMQSEEVLSAGKANGYSKSTLDRAKRRAGVKSVKFGVFNGTWYWEIDPKITTLSDVTTFGGNRPLSPSGSTTSSKIVTDVQLTTFGAEDSDPEVGLV